MNRIAIILAALALAGCMCKETRAAGPQPIVETIAPGHNTTWRVYLYGTERWCRTTERYAVAYRGQDAIAVAVNGGATAVGCWEDAGRDVGARVNFYGVSVTYDWATFYKPGSRP
jgi:hypothetical protein